MTAVATTAPLRHNPAWGNEVVPALRKRLESESRTLSHRLSVIEDQKQHPPDFSSPPRKTIPYSPRPMASPPSRIPAPRKSGTYTRPEHPNGSAPLLHHQSSQASIVVPRSNKPKLINEPLPSPRASIDSQLSSASSQHPFEHWYRGDTSRNGGVGELRVGKRQEMLDIANYGHTLARRREREAEVALGRMARRRAGSVNVLERTSFYDAESNSDLMLPGAGSAGTRVQDERPLTDIETDNGQDYDEYEADPNQVNPAYYDEDSIAVGYSADPPTPSSEPQRRFPTLPQEHSDSPPAPSMTASPTSVRTVPTPRPRAASNPRPNGTPNGKLGVTASLNSRDPRKNNRLAVSQATRQRVESMRKMEKQNQERRSVAAYPELDPNTTPESIPNISSSAQAGRWDDVVIPVVAKKKGIAPPLPPQPKTNPPPSALSSSLSEAPSEPPVVLVGSSLQNKHRMEAYELDDFATPRNQGPSQENPYDSVPIPTMRTGVGTRGDDLNAAPFSRYGPPHPEQQDGLGQPSVPSTPPGATDVSKQELDVERRRMEKEEEKAGCGCCVVM